LIAGRSFSGSRTSSWPAAFDYSINGRDWQSFLRTAAAAAEALISLNVPSGVAVMMGSG
jgi:hypothetical protein